MHVFAPYRKSTEKSINASKRSLKFKDYGNVTVFEECLYFTFFTYNCSQTVGYSNHRPLSCYF